MGVRLKPASFAYHRAGSVPEAVALLADLGDEAKILAGGLSLVPMMNFRLARPNALVDVTRIPGLSYLRPDQGGLRIGALTTHRQIETTADPGVLADFGVLPRAARWIGHYPIRSRGTFGRASRKFIIGTRLSPPARILASSPRSASRATASGTLPAR